MKAVAGVKGVASATQSVVVPTIPRSSWQGTPGPGNGGGMFAGTLFNMKFWGKNRPAQSEPADAVATDTAMPYSVGPEGQRDDRPNGASLAVASTNSHLREIEPRR